MAAVKVTITGTLYDKLARTSQQVVLIGEASYTDVGVGGGPIIPSPGDPHPEHPIVIVPPGAIDGVHPEHPIYLPVYPAHPIELPPEGPPPAPGFQWVYTDEYGWVLDPMGGGKPRPLPPGE